MPQDGIPQDRSFADMLLALGNGSFHDEASEAVAKLVKEMNRVAEHAGGKPRGEITLKIKFALDRGIMDLDPSVTVKTPATIRARTIMYPTADGRLSRNDLRQGMLPLDEARTLGHGEVKDIRSRQANDR